MASPQVENGHIDIANTIADRFCLYRLSGQEWQIIWVILRKTWGWLLDPKKKNGEKKKMDRIALSQFESLTGIDRRKCHSILKKLILKKVIKKVVTQKGDRFVITYGFQKNYDRWKVSPKKVTVTQKGDWVSPKKVTKVSPKKAHTKDNKEIITKDKEIITKDKEIYKEKFDSLESFDFFWDKYNKKIDRKKCVVKFKKLKKSDVEKILNTVESYVSANSDTQYRKNPLTYITGECWNDEIINKKGFNNGKAKHYNTIDTREPVIPERKPTY